MERRRMSRMRESNHRNPAAANTQGAERAAFTARLQLILQHWPSADRLARAMAVSPSAFRKWLRGEAEPSRERLVALADAAKVGIAWLAKGEGPAPHFEHSESGGGHAWPDQGAPGIDPNRFVVLPRQAEAVAAG